MVTSFVHVEIITIQSLNLKVKFDGNFPCDYQELVKFCPAMRNFSYLIDIYPWPMVHDFSFNNAQRLARTNQLGLFTFCDILRGNLLVSLDH